MDEAFASLEDLKDRLDWELDEGEERVGKNALDDLSDQARFYGSNWPDTTKAPRMVRSLVLAAATRYMRNPDGYTTSRAGDETLSWEGNNNSEGGSAFFNDREIKALKQMAGQVGLFSVPMTVWGKQRNPASIAGYVPTPNGRPFPLFASPTDPW